MFAVFRVLICQSVRSKAKTSALIANIYIRTNIVNEYTGIVRPLTKKRSQ